MNPAMIIGAPGTGKTYHLVNTIQDLQPKKFAFLSFTRRAAIEAKQRLSKLYGDKDLKYVKTIHSICFDLLGLRSSQVLTYKHAMAFAEQYGYEFTARPVSQEDGTWYGMTEDDIEYRMMQIQIAKLQEPEMKDSQMFRSYSKFKEDNHLIDFHDMIKLVIDKPTLLPKFDLVCIDEIQDLSPLQMQFVYLCHHSSDATIFAGDGDQMIFEWAGVDRQEFIRLQRSCRIFTLEKNYRIPQNIINKAKNVLFDAPNYPINSDNIYPITGLPEFELNETYLILARNTYIIRHLMREYDEMGFTWTWLASNQYLPKGAQFNIMASTIHGAKGAEADNVVIIPDVSAATFENLESESERRVWYVGLTRARKRLFLLEPQTSMYYDLL